MHRHAVALAVILSAIFTAIAFPASAIAQTAAPAAPAYGYAAQSPPAPAYGYAAQAPPAYSHAPQAAPIAEKPAAQAARPRAFHLDLGGGTEFPLYAGGLITAELPHRFLLQLGAGVMPRAYAEAIDSVLSASGAYDAVVSQVIRSSLGNSLVVRASLGGRPFAAHGFEILGGYTLVTMGGSATTSDIINAVLLESGSTFQVPAGLGGEVPVSATLHNFHASIGWRWLLADDRLVIRASLSYIQTLGSQISVKVPAEAALLAPYEGVINSEVNAFLGPYFTRYAKAPTLGLSAAVRF